MPLGPAFLYTTASLSLIYSFFTNLLYSIGIMNYIGNNEDIEMNKKKLRWQWDLILAGVLGLLITTIQAISSYRLHSDIFIIELGFLVKWLTIYRAGGFFFQFLSFLLNLAMFYAMSKILLYLKSVFVNTQKKDYKE